MGLVSRALHTRWFVRSPIRLYRSGLGFLLGDRMLMLTHRGRTSGEPRYVVLEVSDRPAPDRIVVVAGLGPRSQWFRNIQADPRVLVSIGRRRDVRARAAVMSPDDGAAMLARYAAEHPGSWNALQPVVAEWAEPLARERGLDDSLRVVPVVELRLELD
ncbi:nitroreductase family deazaflavin-dependent oxidoreductase [Isoptericola sp. NEAU-Y5]|uniref:Nitroreductase family deazaflavin-dependent oxidoreductase n=1 Tax=Isoptericola luteus TaxID=2879484 RepID=A0ABS7ZDV9_9MICO|nr:nitroreductase family deazaflavin-dependent oxidoreductase [Isoptericola sp. NEAU-Y5]MCA5892009.1 nitroreductase family deazaflavin-dependent oxidoreductase [Isoptericola sp. NEAU-Y5]